MDLHDYCLDIFESKIKILGLVKANASLNDVDKKYYLFAGKLVEIYWTLN